MTKAFSEVQWQTFLDFSEDNYFFIREQDPIEGDEYNPFDDKRASTSYLCFEVTNSKTTAHPQTRGLNNISFSFKVFNGL